MLVHQLRFRFIHTLSEVVLLMEELIDPPMYFQIMLGAGLPYATHTRSTVERAVTFSSAEDSTMLTLVDSVV